MQRHRDYTIHVAQMFTPCYPLPQHSSEMFARLQIAPILQIVQDHPVIGIVIIKEQGATIGVVLRSDKPRTFLYQLVEPVCHRIVRPFPEMSEGHICIAMQTQMPLVYQKFPAAHNAHPWQHQIRQRLEMV